MSDCSVAGHSLSKGRRGDVETVVVDAVAAVLAANPDVRVGDVAMAARLTVITTESVVHRVVTHDPPDDLGRFEDELVAMLVRYLTGGGAGRAALVDVV